MWCDVRPTQKACLPQAGVELIIDNGLEIDFHALTFPVFGDNLLSLFPCSRPKTGIILFVFIPEFLPIDIRITRGYYYLTTSWSVVTANVCVSTNIILFFSLPMFVSPQTLSSSLPMFVSPQTLSFFSPFPLGLCGEYFFIPLAKAQIPIFIFPTNGKTRWQLKPSPRYDFIYSEFSILNSSFLSVSFPMIVFSQTFPISAHLFHLWFSFFLRLSASSPGKFFAPFELIKNNI